MRGERRAVGDAAGRRETRRPAAWLLLGPAFAAGACLLAAPPAAAALTLTVDSTADAVDALPGNGACSTAAGKCTLRAAIQEANA
jgi:CSLREA domain-containing protein